MGNPPASGGVQEVAPPEPPEPPSRPTRLPLGRSLKVLPECFRRYFLWRFSVLCSTLNFLSDSYTWPLLVYMLLICVYPFTSSCAHTFSTMSPESRHICYFFDYGALSLYSLGG